MALVTYRRDQLVSNTLGKIATENGFVSIKDSPVLGAIVSAVEQALSEGYRELYDIARNVDIGRATGEYLDRWGNLLGEPRSVVGYANDMTLTNTYIQLQPDVPASQLTVDGQGIMIPAGTLLSSEDGMYSVTTVGDAYMLPSRSRVFVKVIATSTAFTSIPAGTLSYVHLSVGQIANVAAGAAKAYRFIAYNTLPIEGGRGFADDELYRYILKESTQSIWLFNDARIRKLMDILQVRHIVIEEYRGGVIVYIETTEPSVADQVAAIAKHHLSTQKPCGYALTVSPVNIRALRLTLRAEFSTSDPSRLADYKHSFATTIAANINDRYAGEAVDIQEAVSTAAAALPDVTSYSIARATVDGRTLLTFSVPQQSNQKLYLDPTLVVFE